MDGSESSGYSSIYGGTATGCVGTSVSAAVEWNPGDDGAPATCQVGRRWNKEGVKASTTGNMYGIYDIAGGAWELVMGAMVNEKEGGVDIKSTGFTVDFGENSLPNDKYYDIYTFDSSNISHERGHYGDATKETLDRFGYYYGEWNLDIADFPSTTSFYGTWFYRGGGFTYEFGSGVFSIGRGSGGRWYYTTFRSVLSAA